MAFKDYLRRGFRFVVRGVPSVTVTPLIYQIEYGRIFEGRNCIVTGGSSGIGFEIAKKWTICGGRVLITGRNEEKLNLAREKLGQNCYSRLFDHSEIDKCKELCAEAHSIFGGDVDSLVCNAGISLHEKDIFHVDIEGYRKQFATNLDGYYFMTKAFLDGVVGRNGNKEYSVLMISSERGLQCDDVPYGLTKAAINSLVRGLNRRLYTNGVRINAIAPGITLSEMNPGRISRENLYIDRISSHRYFLPEEIAETAIFLLSDASKCISGEVIACDAGNYLDSYIQGI